MKKFAFYVSNNGTRLKKFLQLYKNKILIGQIEFVLIDNCENFELKKICTDLNIIYYEVNLKDEENKNEYISNLFLDYLTEHAVDYAFIFANKILVGELLSKYKNKLINFHPSILPSHKGLHAIDKALKENTFLLGNSAHIVTKELDNGSIIMQNIFPAIMFRKYDDILDNQLIMILQIMEWINSDRLKFIDDTVIIEGAVYLAGAFIPNIEIGAIQ
jgi:phosphoribosylglycinamide formyltransferase-1